MAHRDLRVTELKDTVNVPQHSELLIAVQFDERPGRWMPQIMLRLVRWVVFSLFHERERPVFNIRQGLRSPQDDPVAVRQTKGH